MNIFTKRIAAALHLPEKCVDNTLQLLSEGCTIPFIARYRKEKTGGLDEVQIAQIADMSEKLQELVKRKETVIKTITEQGKMTPELLQQINDCWESTTLEDLYLPYRPKRHTRAQVARERGLEPLADIIMLQRESRIDQVALRFVKDEVKDIDMALQGAQDIIAERISEDERVRNIVRQSFQRNAMISSKVVKSKQDTDEAAKYRDYFSFSEPLK